MATFNFLTNKASRPQKSISREQALRAFQVEEEEEKQVPGTSKQDAEIRYNQMVDIDAQASTHGLCVFLCGSELISYNHMYLSSYIRSEPCE